MTREQFMDKLFRIRDAFFGDTSSEKIEKVKPLVVEVAAEISALTGADPLLTAMILDTLMTSEAKRQEFFEVYEIPFESANICLQM